MEFKSGWYAILTTRNNLSSFSPFFFFNHPSLSSFFSLSFRWLDCLTSITITKRISGLVVRRAILIERTRRRKRSFLFHIKFESKQIYPTNKSSYKYFEYANTLFQSYFFQMQSTFQIHFFRSELTRFSSAFEKKRKKKEKSGKRKIEINRAIEAKRVN